MAIDTFFVFTGTYPDTEVRSPTTTRSRCCTPKPT